LPVPSELAARKPGIERFDGRDVIVGIRPQDFETADVVGGDHQRGRLRAEVELVEALGTQTQIHFAIDAPVVMTEDMKELAADVGGEQVEKLEEQAQQGRNEFVAEVDPKSDVTAGNTVDLVVDTTQLHFFDPETALGVYG
jgi:multiple sugar transport system ATP-binding protein